MLAYSSPHLLSTTYHGWPLDNIITQNLHQDFNDIISTELEANSYHHSLLDFPTYDHQILQDFVPENNSISKSSGEAENGNTSHDPKKAAKKLNHNASERDRRKRVNDLYSFLRSLLPTSGDQKKKESIPRTVSRALKYIPELQKEVESLLRKKEKLLSYSSSTANYTSQDSFGMIKKQSVKDDIVERKSSVVVSSVSVLGDHEKEAVIQLTSSANDHKHTGFLLSKVLEYLEQEEDGVDLLNSTTFNCVGVNSTTLHIQVQGDKKVEAERLKGKLCSFYQQ